MNMSAVHVTPVLVLDPDAEDDVVVPEPVLAEVDPLPDADVDPDAEDDAVVDELDAFVDDDDDED